MLINTTVTKNFLEKIIRNSFYIFGEYSTSYFLDSLKLLGFNYATNAGISINIEDLRIPLLKESLIRIAYEDVEKINDNWYQGKIAETERFKAIIDNWNLLTENLKTQIIDYYKEYDPLNNLYIMAFSGARGNISQVRQLIAMRGLMADQEGNIIDLPIVKNFREGLTSLDYLISSYGARKGIVDTALKTADSGYLTRRLIYLCQDLIIKEINCQTSNGILILRETHKNIKNLLGRFLISYKLSLDAEQISINQVIDNSLLLTLEKNKFYSIKVKSPLTCALRDSICQFCYGWDLSDKNLIRLGTTIGIIAAQSIGEPGTQLTMRTFHTGGVFTSQGLSQLKAPFSGKLIFPSNSVFEQFRTLKGELVYKVPKELKIDLINWKGETKQVFFPSSTYLYINSSTFVKKGTVLAEFSIKLSSSKNKRIKPLFSPLEGQLKVDRLLIRSISKQNCLKASITQEDCSVVLIAGQIFPFSKGINIKLSHKLNKKKAIAEFSIISPFSGFCFVNNNQIILKSREQNLRISYSKLERQYKHLHFEIFPILKNTQYLDKLTIFAKGYLFPQFNSNVYSIRKKDTNNKVILFCITDKDVWKLNLDEVNSNIDIKSTPLLLGTSIEIKNAGILVKKDGFRLIFQKIFPIFLRKGSFLHCKKNDFVYKNQILGNLITHIEQTQDIVQGLPKIEEIIEARSLSNKKVLLNKNGIFLNQENDNRKEIYKIYLKKNQKIIIQSKSKLSPTELFVKQLKIKIPFEKYQTISLVENTFSNNLITYFQGKIWYITKLNPFYKPIKSNKLGAYYKFSDKHKNIFSTKGGIKTWQKLYAKNLKEILLDVFELKNKLENLTTLKVKNEFFFNSKKEKDSFIFSNENSQFFILEEFNLINTINHIENYPLQFQPGQYIDIGSSLFEERIDLQKLFKILTEYSTNFDGVLKGFLKGLHKFQLILGNSIQAIYESQGVNINNKHIEIVVKQMTSKVMIKEKGDTELIPGEIIKLSLAIELWKAFQKTQKKLRLRNFEMEAFLFSATKHSLLKEGFLTAAGFQETRKVLSKAAIEGRIDWLTGLKEAIIVGRQIFAGSSFLTYKYNLDKKYKFLDIK